MLMLAFQFYDGPVNGLNKGLDERSSNFPQGKTADLAEDASKTNTRFLPFFCPPLFLCDCKLAYNSLSLGDGYNLLLLICLIFI